MGKFFREIKSALKEMWGDFGQGVIWDGAHFNCTVSEAETSVELLEGGFVRDCEFTVKFLEEELYGRKPRIGDKVTYNKIDYKIESVSNYAKRGQLAVTIRAIR